MFFGLFLLTVLIFEIFLQKNTLIKFFIKLLKILIFSGFLFHTVFLVFRSIISGHAPWSDAYESLIFISFSMILLILIMYLQFKKGSLDLEEMDKNEY